MNARTIVPSALWIGAVASAFAVGTVVGEQAPPTENKGSTPAELIVVDIFKKPAT